MGMGQHDDAADRQTDCSEALLRVYEFLDGELGPATAPRSRLTSTSAGPV